MTREQKDSLWSALWKVGPILILVGIAWGTLVADVRGRVGVPRFEAESIRASYWRQNEDDRLSRMQNTLNKIDDRLSRMYCRGNPDPACQ